MFIEFDEALFKFTKCFKTLQKFENGVEMHESSPKLLLYSNNLLETLL